MRVTPTRAAPFAVGAALLLGGCATLRAPPPASAPSGAAIVAVANTLVGAPYQFGGADAAGFDCSGLALYVYERVGIAIPRTAAAQQRAARAVPAAQLAPGDLVFFHIHARAIDHVGIYSGGGRFIHAPRAGHAVEYADLYKGFYARRFVSAGRFW